MNKDNVSYLIIGSLLLGLFILPPALNATQTARAKVIITINSEPVFPDTSNRCGGTTRHGSSR